MTKRTQITVANVAFAALLLAGCANYFDDDGGAPSGIGAERGCLDSFAECLDDPTTEYDECAAISAECAAVDDCAPRSCRADYESCVAAGIDDGRCETFLRECLATEAPVPVDCRDDYATCLDSGLDPDACDGLLDDCPPPEYAPIDGCDRLYEECLSTSDDPSVCATQREACLAGYAMVPDDCGEGYADCVVDEGWDSVRCEALLESCPIPPEPHFCRLQNRDCLARGDGEERCSALLEACLRTHAPVPHECRIQHEECLDRGDGFVRCDALLEACLRPYAPVPEECTDAVITCIDDDGAICDSAITDCAPAPHPCRIRHEICLAGMEDGDRSDCDHRLHLCLRTYAPVPDSCWAVFDGCMAMSDEAGIECTDLLIDCRTRG